MQMEWSTDLPQNVTYVILCLGSHLQTMVFSFRVVLRS
jgi:hypothetical protein